MITNEQKDLSVIKHIHNHCEIIERAINKFGNTFESFKAEEMFRDGISMNILQIGELVNHLSDEFKESTQTLIPWREIRGMRNLFAHNYHHMDIEMVWFVATTDIPILKSFCYQQISLEKANENEFDNGLEL